jgi:hypothetical protein
VGDDPEVSTHHYFEQNAVVVASFGPAPGVRRVLSPYWDSSLVFLSMLKSSSCLAFAFLATPPAGGVFIRWFEYFPLHRRSTQVCASFCSGLVCVRSELDLHGVLIVDRK